jgi:hypothetical protein
MFESSTVSIETLVARDILNSDSNTIDKKKGFLSPLCRSSPSLLLSCNVCAVVYFYLVACARETKKEH